MNLRRHSGPELLRFIEWWDQAPRTIEKRGGIS
jgi:hypothetical protein